MNYSIISGSKIFFFVHIKLLQKYQSSSKYYYNLHIIIYNIESLSSQKMPNTSLFSERCLFTATEKHNLVSQIRQLKWSKEKVDCPLYYFPCHEVYLAKTSLQRFRRKSVGGIYLYPLATAHLPSFNTHTQLVEVSQKLNGGGDLRIFFKII